jgi:bifunctional NMN adenylyltransferase/nudix hydrolase
MKNFDYSVFIGHFSPVSLDDEVVFKEALSQSEKLIIVIGSDKKARNIKTPWTSSERVEMVKATLTAEELSRVEFVLLRDQLYNETLWVMDLLDQISEITGKSDSVALFFKERDKSDYLEQFPQWEHVPVKSNPANWRPNDIRYHYFTYDTAYQRHVNANIVKFLESFKDSENFKNLKSDFDYIRDYRSQWQDAPFQPVFVTVDTVVIKSGHILLVRRKGNPGKGQIALPGGFLNQKEFIETAALRELREETVIKVSKEELKKLIKEVHVFDAPDRSLRGRTITHAYLIDLGTGPLPQVKGSDDADKAWWEPLNSAMGREEEFFEDHWHIMNFFLGRQ